MASFIKIRRIRIYLCCTEFNFILYCYSSNYYFYNHKKIRYLYYIYKLVKIRRISDVIIPCQTKIGSGLQIRHACSIIINDLAIIGDNCILSQNTTIGLKLGYDLMEEEMGYLQL